VNRMPEWLQNVLAYGAVIVFFLSIFIRCIYEQYKRELVKFNIKKRELIRRARCLESSTSPR